MQTGDSQQQTLPQRQTLAASRRTVLVSVNPRAGYRDRSAAAEHLSEALAGHGFTTEQFTDIALLKARAEELHAADQLRAAVAAGGDGTIALLANITPHGAPLAIMPLGTENLLARHLGLSAEPAAVAQVIADGITHSFDMGDAGGRLFSLMAGCGFDAEVVRRLHTERKGNIHHLSYIKPIFEAIRTYEYPELRVRYAPTDAAAGTELTEELTARWVFVVNIPRYAGGLNLALGAAGDDGLLDVCTFREGSLWNGLLYLGGIMLGQQQSMTDFTHIRTRQLRIEASTDVPFQLDGDPGGTLPVEICVRPGRLNLLVAREWAEKQAASQIAANQ
ncbi:diacylglycerol/lipid kinase family protein [Anatilimnocola floriformis]|uniref:diacylglycerol/lipid kinase family protein n=1 Tax=Anatilimnocola floriformis TaxID=2948575 RepID=UPI0020C30568|nr:diacylglycerol kinase family protein [Anatilimnocola floriformis]